MASFRLDNPDGQGAAFDPDEDMGGFPSLKTADEINAIGKKADVIAYAESIGLQGLNENQRLDELKEAVLNHQEERYEGQDG